MRIMGIDYGDNNIGIAISDPFGWTAQGVETIKWNGNNLIQPVERINKLIIENQVEKIVVGFPKNMNGTIGPRGERTSKFIEYLEDKLDNKIEIITWDERLSTVAATRTMRETGVKKNKKKGIVDQLAAMYILQGYLDSIGIKKG